MLPVTSVLFVCRTNASLGPMAEAYLNQIGDGLVRAFSAGVSPASEIAPQTGRTLEMEGVAADGLSPKALAVFALPGAPQPDILVLLSSDLMGLHVPAWVRQPRRFVWPLNDPGLTENGRPSLSSFRTAFHALRTRIDQALQHGAFLSPTLAAAV